MKAILTNKAPAPIGPYSQAIAASNTVYISGQIALDTQGVFRNETVEMETEQVLKNLEFVLQAAQLSFSNVVKVTVFLTDMDDFMAVNEVYGRAFDGSQPPARETVAVKALPKGARVEISAIAVREAE